MGIQEHRRIADRYVLGAQLGRGGMAVVWRAEDTLLRRAVAIKEVRLPPTLPPKEQESTRARVLREARTAARLSHPGAVTIFDVVEHDNKAFIVMELLEAPSLQEVVQREGPLDPGATAAMGLAVAGALEAAHLKSIVHRDVKPANVMLLPDTGAKLADFGIATSKDDTRLTSTGVVLGSPGYMAPEQAHGRPSTAASDLWGLGATMYYALEGRAPFQRPSPIATMGAIVSEEPEPPRRAEELAPLILALLSKDPERRPSASELRDALRHSAPAGTAEATTRPVVPARWTTEEPARRTTEEPVRPVTVEPVRPVEQVAAAQPRSRRSGWWALALAIALLAAVAFAVYLAFGGSNDGGARQTAAPSKSERPKAESSASATATATPATETIGVPRSWTPYTIGDTGFTIAHPASWGVIAQDESRIDFRDPGTGAYLRLDWTDTPGPDPVAAWEELSDSFGATHDGYTEIRIDPVSFKGYEAAEWEFTYSESGAELHAIDLGFVTGEYGFALNFQTTEEEWDANQDVFEAFKTSFGQA